MDRRKLISQGCSELAALMGGQKLSFSFGSEQDLNRDILVVVFLRGGCDGLSLLAPAENEHYVAARGGNLAIPTTGNFAGLNLHSSLDKTNFWLHPKAKALQELFQSKDLAFVHACGLTNGTRSHFDAIDLMERGTPNSKSTTTGWLTRLLQSSEISSRTPAFSIGQSSPVSLMGYPSALSFQELKEFKIGSDDAFQSALSKLYQDSSPIGMAGKNTIEAMQYLSKRARVGSNGEVLPYEPSVEYPANWASGTFNTSLKTVAQLVKMEVGMQVATVDFGGWDHHEGQTYLFPMYAEALSNSLAAFYNDLSAYHKRLTVVVMTEFGRRLKANESGGTDHGHGSVMMVLGGNVSGGKLYGKWPGLASDQLDNYVDLAVTTDYRKVLSEILVRRLKHSALEKVFPGFSDTEFLNLCNA